MSLEKYSNISEFLENIGRSTEVRKALRKGFSEKDLATMDKYLTLIDFSQDRYGVWGNMIRNEEFMPMLTELTLIYHLRKSHGIEPVEIHRPLQEGSNSKNFDVYLDINHTGVWIEVTYENLVEKIDSPGLYPRKMTGFQIDQKIQEDFLEANSLISRDDVLILALYLEGRNVQEIMTGNRLREGGVYEVEEYLDGYIEFSWFWDPTFEYFPFTNTGKSIADELLGVDN